MSSALSKIFFLAVCVCCLPGLSVAGQYKVIKVYDGNTVKVMGQGKTLRVRLVGIDAPERGQPYHAESGKHLADLVLDRFVTLRDFNTGSSRRLLGEIFLKDVNINLEMLSAGLAEVYRGDITKELDIRAYFDAEAEARKAEVGVWSLGKRYVSPSVWRKARKRMHRLKYGSEPSYGTSDPGAQNLP
jgi:endonuclease YncB( thermonuclease family)